MLKRERTLATGFEVQVHGRSIHLSGELDMASVADFLADLLPLADEPGDITIHLSELTFLDSSGLQALLRIADVLRGSLVLLDPSQPVRRVLEITGTLDRFVVRPPPG